MNKTDMVLQALVNCALADGDKALIKARKELQKAVRGYEESRKNPEMLIMSILMEIGAPEYMAGYDLVVTGIQMLLENKDLINHMRRGFYFELGEKFDVMPSNVEGRIRQFVERTWEKGDMDALNKYFGGCVGPDKGQPSNGAFLARLANIVRLEMKK